MSITWITGAHGFIGRHLARCLTQRGFIVCGIGHGLWPTEDAAAWGVSTWVNGGIDSSNLAYLGSVGRPAIIFHLAGGSAVGPSLQNPLEDFRRTVDTTARLLDWVKAQVPEATVVCASSAAVYGAGHDGPIAERAHLNPYSPYGSHKAMMEMLCRSYAASFGLDSRVVRLFSVYGAHLRKQLLWDICSRLASGVPVVRLGGSGQELRDWIHVRDAARLLLLSAEAPKSEFSIINGGTGCATSVRQVAEMVIAAWGGGVAVEFSGERRGGDPHSLVSDMTLAHQLGFSPEVSLPEGIAEYVRSFRASRDL